MLKLEYKDYMLKFNFEAGTSRGILREHRIVLIKVFDSRDPGIYGLGEAAPLHELSPETVEDVLESLEVTRSQLMDYPVPDSEEAIYQLVRRIIPSHLPSLKFALETALLDLTNNGKRIVFDGRFSRGDLSIAINGLVWMGSSAFIREQIDHKLSEGCKCIKVKIGALDFKEELSLLQYLRGRSDQIVLRLDANGAFKNNEVFKKLQMLEELRIHSIEQPIAPDQWNAMELVCKRSPIPIALDEELIGTTDAAGKEELLKFIKPQFLVLKPTLLGGFYETLEWIGLAHRLNIGWWITSALESNIGLNAIAQFTGRFETTGYHGLGTGQLYHNNFESPLEVDGELLKHNHLKQWMLPDMS